MDAETLTTIFDKELHGIDKAIADLTAIADGEDTESENYLPLQFILLDLEALRKINLLARDMY